MQLSFNDLAVHNRWAARLFLFGSTTGPYRFYFYSFDCQEPRHVHVRRERSVCKFWLEPVSLANNNGFSPKDLNRIRSLIVQYLAQIVEAWDEHCGNV